MEGETRRERERGREEERERERKMEGERERERGLLTVLFSLVTGLINKPAAYRERIRR